LIAGATCAALGPAAATTLRLLDLAGLSHTSSDIVLGRVETVQARWTPDHRTIITEVRVRVEDRVKGGGDAVLTLIEPGGEVDGVRVEVDAVPAFTVGERTVVFATRRAGDATAHVLGMAQGKFEVTVDAAGTPRVHRLAPGFAFSDAKTLKAVSANSSRALPTRGASPTLENFLGAVREAVGGGGR